jgi:cytochrome oxidase Cu insertion factor (SCO1/SenC/PrrC family)
MPVAYLISLLAAVGLMNLLLIVALVRRIRSQDDQLAARSRPRPLPAMTVGRMAPDFTVTTVSGKTRSLSDLQGDRGVIAFLTPDSETCRARVPDLIEYARAHPTGRTHVVTVICGTGKQAARLAGELQEYMSVVVEPRAGPMQQAYSVSGHPLFYVIRADGQIAARGAYVEAFDGAHLRVITH